MPKDEEYLSGEFGLYHIGIKFIDERGNAEVVLLNTKIHNLEKIDYLGSGLIVGDKNEELYNFVLRSLEANGV